MIIITVQTRFKRLIWSIGYFSYFKCHNFITDALRLRAPCVNSLNVFFSNEGSLVNRPFTFRSSEVIHTWEYGNTVVKKTRTGIPLVHPCKLEYFCQNVNVTLFASVCHQESPAQFMIIEVQSASYDRCQSHTRMCGLLARVVGVSLTSKLSSEIKSLSELSRPALLKKRDMTSHYFHILIIIDVFINFPIILLLAYKCENGGNL